MTELAAITPERHAKKVWKHVTDYAFAAEQTVIPLVGAELSKVAPVMPTGFIKLDAGYQLVAITSLQPGTNLYVAPDGKWLGAYIPAALRGYPFKLAQQEGAGEFILCIDEASGLVVENTETLSSTIKTSPLRESRTSLTSSPKSRPAGMSPRGP